MYLDVRVKLGKGGNKGFVIKPCLGEKNESITFHENLTSIVHLVIMQIIQIKNFLSRSVWHNVSHWVSVVVRQSSEAPSLMALPINKTSCESRAENELMKYKKHEVNSLPSC